MPIGGPKAHVTLSMTRRGGPFLAASFGGGDYLDGLV